MGLINEKDNKNALKNETCLEYFQREYGFKNIGRMVKFYFIYRTNIGEKINH